MQLLLTEHSMFTVSDVYQLKIIVSRQSRIFIYNYICMHMIRLYFLCTLPIVIKLLLFMQLKTTVLSMS